MLFSYATARSLITAKKVTQGLDARIPLIVYNGAFVMDNVTGEIMLSNYFGDDIKDLLDELFAAGIYPIVYAYIDGKEKFSYAPSLINPGTKKFTDSREGDIRINKVESAQDLKEGDIFYVTCIDEPARLLPFYEANKERYHCVYQKDIYTGEQWLEIMPKTTSKAHAARRLKELLGCERVVAFGDGPNDIELFDVADESYAVANAVPELKCRATAVIGSNEDDGVAKWLAEHANPKGN